MRRAWKLLAYFQKNEFEVDLVYNEVLERMSDIDIQQLKDIGGIKNIFGLRKKPQKGDFFSYLFRYKIGKLVKDRKYKKSFPNLVTPYNKRLFNKILAQNRYDYIIISYLYWAELIKNNSLTKGARLIVDTHDFLTSQEQQKKGFRIGVAFQDEINRVKLFDEVWVVSTDEEYLFSQFCDKKIRLVPIAFNAAIGQPKENTSFDLIYVASDNPHNVRAAQWFFKEVYPLLRSSISICVIGKVGSTIEDRPNIIKHQFVADLNEYYQRARVAICPMLSGTGVKVKVIEAMSHGLPIVCSRRGVDGLVNKSGNGCLVAEKKADFARLIEELLENQELYRRVSQEASAYFSEYHAKEVFERILDHAFNVNDC